MKGKEYEIIELEGNIKFLSLPIRNISKEKYSVLVDRNCCALIHYQLRDPNANSQSDFMGIPIKEKLK